LTKSRDRRFFGVCGGIAEHFGWQPGSVRGAWFFASLLTGGIGGLLIYLLLAVIMPSAPPAFDLDDFSVQ
jgi:phage shock protein C